MNQIKMLQWANDNFFELSQHSNVQYKRLRHIQSHVPLTMTDYIIALLQYKDFRDLRNKILSNPAVFVMNCFLVGEVE